MAISPYILRKTSMERMRLFGTNVRAFDMIRYRAETTLCSRRWSLSSRKEMTNIRMFFYYTSLASTTGVFFRIIVPTYLTYVIHDRLSVLFNQS